jgi:hypothetical protein
LLHPALDQFSLAQQTFLLRVATDHPIHYAQKQTVEFAVQLFKGTLLNMFDLDLTELLQQFDHGRTKVVLLDDLLDEFDDKPRLILGLEQFGETKYLVDLEDVAQAVIGFEGLDHQRLHVRTTLLEFAAEVLIDRQRLLEATGVVDRHALLYVLRQDLLQRL